MNREAWLIKASEKLGVLLEEVGQTAPEVRVSVGFPKGRGGKKFKAIGQCWSGACAGDGLAQVFIHPELADAVRVLDVLLHEIIHATVGTECGHKGAFKQVALAVGLTGKMTATEAGEDLKPRLEAIAQELGEYPHSALNSEAGGGKKQGTRLIKCECDECGYVVRTTAKWLEALGPVFCPCNNEKMIIG